MYNRSIRHFLRYLAYKALIPASLAYTLDRFVIQRIIILDKNTHVKKSSYVHCSQEDLIEIPAVKYYSLAKELGDTYLQLHNYSKMMKNVFRKAWKELYIFLEANELNYSYEIAIYWCNSLKNYTVQWKAYRRAIKLFEQYMNYGDIKPNIG